MGLTLAQRETHARISLSTGCLLICHHAQCYLWNSLSLSTAVAMLHIYNANAAAKWTINGACQTNVWHVLQFVSFCGVAWHGMAWQMRAHQSRTPVPLSTSSPEAITTLCYIPRTHWKESEKSESCLLSDVWYMKQSIGMSITIAIL